MEQIKKHKELDVYFQKMDHVDVKTIEGIASLRSFISGMLSYYPWWMIVLYRIREIIVNIQRAVETASRIGKRWSKQKEFALYIAHGCDHLWGEDDHDDAGRKRMRRRELNWIKDLDKNKLLYNLID